MDKEYTYEDPGDPGFELCGEDGVPGHSKVRILSWLEKDKKKKKKRILARLKLDKRS